MPYAAKKPCLAFNCGVLSDHSYCPEHMRKKKAEKDRQRPNARRRGYDYKWEKDRARYLRENPLCTIHLQDGRTERATVVDHIIPHRGNRNRSGVVAAIVAKRVGFGFVEPSTVRLRKSGPGPEKERSSHPTNSPSSNSSRRRGDTDDFPNTVLWMANEPTENHRRLPINALASFSAARISHNTTPCPVLPT